MRWSLYFGPSRPPLGPVAPGSLAEQKASRTQLIFLHLGRQTPSEEAGKQRGHLKCFRGDVWGQLITCSQDHIIYYIFITFHLFSQTDADETDLADYLERCHFDCWRRTLETHSLMLNGSYCCDQPRCSHCTLGNRGLRRRYFTQRQLMDT